MFQKTASDVLAAWNAFNSFLPIAALLLVTFAGALVAFAIRKGKGIFSWALGR